VFSNTAPPPILFSRSEADLVYSFTERVFAAILSPHALTTRTPPVFSSWSRSDRRDRLLLVSAIIVGSDAEMIHTVPFTKPFIRSMRQTIGSSTATNRSMSGGGCARTCLDGAAGCNSIFVEAILAGMKAFFPSGFKSDNGGAAPRCGQSNTFQRVGAVQLAASTACYGRGTRFAVARDDRSGDYGHQRIGIQGMSALWLRDRPCRRTPFESVEDVRAGRR
jgi:hypothetical protein